jgi:Na+/H+ antiporter NhaA
MNSPHPEFFHAWHDFFILLGTACATLVGLMFIAVSIGASIFKEENRPALEVFLGPTVVHFTSVLVLCVLAIVPSHSWLSLAGLTGLIGFAGFLFSARIWFRLTRSRYELDYLDRFCYTVLPAIGYLLVLFAASLLYEQSEWGLDAAAIGLITLLLAGIRNAWDMMTWIALKVPNAGEESKGGSTTGVKPSP